MESGSRGQWYTKGRLEELGDEIRKGTRVGRAELWRKVYWEAEQCSLVVHVSESRK